MAVLDASNPAHPTDPVDVVRGVHGEVVVDDMTAVNPLPLGFEEKIKNKKTENIDSDLHLGWKCNELFLTFLVSIPLEIKSVQDITLT